LPWSLTALHVTNHSVLDDEPMSATLDRRQAR
jgi:hypothetical protein